LVSPPALPLSPYDSWYFFSLSELRRAVGLWWYGVSSSPYTRTPTHNLALLPYLPFDQARKRKSKHTKESPLSFVRFAGKPRGSACSKRSTWPWRAASKNRDASAIASGGSAPGVLLVVVDVVGCAGGGALLGFMSVSPSRSLSPEGEILDISHFDRMFRD